MSVCMSMHICTLISLLSRRATRGGEVRSLTRIPLPPTGPKYTFICILTCTCIRILMHFYIWRCTDWTDLASQQAASASCCGACAEGPLLARPPALSCLFCATRASGRHQGLRKERRRGAASAPISRPTVCQSVYCVAIMFVAFPDVPLRCFASTFFVDIS